MALNLQTFLHGHQTQGYESENQILKDLLVYPVPSKGDVSIDLGKSKNVSIVLYNSKGQVVYQDEELNGSIYGFTIPGPAGIYYLLIKQGKAEKRVKLIKQ